MAFDPVRMQPLLFGGIGSQPFLFTDTWTFHGTAAGFGSFGGGCPGSNGTPRLLGSAPWIGQPIQFQLDTLPASSFAIIFLGLNDTTWNGRPLPMPLGSLGLPGCSLLIAPRSSTGLLPTTSGSLTTTVPIPNLAALGGLSAFFQALVFDPAANAAGAVVSNGVRADLALR